MEVLIVNKSNHRLPEYAHPGDAGMDLKANIDTPIKILPGQNVLIPTGIHTKMPVGIWANIKGRSGLGAKYRIMVFEGTIDSSYTGEWFVNMMNLDPINPYIVQPGDRIAQAVFMKYEHINWNEVAELPDTDRGANGFGSSGK